MKNLLGGAPAPSFEDPLEMLEACHGRILAQFATLKKLLQHLPVHGCDIQAQQAAKAILRYFDTAGQYHHQDEEQDLFPVLLSTQNAEAHALVGRLLDDHKVMEAAWAHLRPLLLAVAEGQGASLETAAVENLVAAYEPHIVMENTQLFPLSAQLLSGTQLEALGRNMAARRGVAA